MKSKEELESKLLPLAILAATWQALGSLILTMGVVL